MIELGPAKEPDVVLTFLKAEIDSPDRYQSIQRLLQACGVTRQRLIDNADLQNDCCNALRRIVLDGYRGYLRKTALFTRFPKEVAWRRVELEGQDLHRLRYVRSAEWMPLSENTRLPQRVADRIARGELPDLAEKLAAIQEKLRRAEALPELVAVEGKGNDLILIEGAHRTTAYFALRWSANLAAYIGSSPLMSDWEFY